MTYFAEELLEGVTTQDMSVRLEAGLTKRLLKEFGHLEPHTEELAGLFFLWGRARVRSRSRRDENTGTRSCELVLKRRGKHVGKELEGNREQELHERDHDKNSKRDDSEQVLRRPSKLRVQNEYWDWSDSYPHTCLRSRRVRVSPWRIFLWRRAEMRTSLARSLEPCQ